MAMWNPWRGCKKCSDGCLHCYIHKGDLKRKINTNEIIKTKDFEKPVAKLKNGNYKMKSGIVYLCFTSSLLAVIPTNKKRLFSLLYGVLESAILIRLIRTGIIFNPYDLLNI